MILPKDSQEYRLDHAATENNYVLRVASDRHPLVDLWYKLKL